MSKSSTKKWLISLVVGFAASIFVIFLTLGREVNDFVELLFIAIGTVALFIAFSSLIHGNGKISQLSFVKKLVQKKNVELIVLILVSAVCSLLFFVFASDNFSHSNNGWTVLFLVQTVLYVLVAKGVVNYFSSKE